MMKFLITLTFDLAVSNSKTKMVGSKGCRAAEAPIFHNKFYKCGHQPEKKYL